VAEEEALNGFDGAAAEPDAFDCLTVSCATFSVPDEGALEDFTGAGALAGPADETVGCLTGDGILWNGFAGAGKPYKVGGLTDDCMNPGFRTREVLN